MSNRFIKINAGTQKKEVYMSNRFIKINAGTTVDLACVSAVADGHALLEGGQSVPITDVEGFTKAWTDFVEADEVPSAHS